ncbi:ubiquitinyl hydrolase 1 [Tulasnella sp. 330]|nr:ubiquitinyl hydrolase 1 [Tulasnella sp. 330]KAG8874503.1 ubiquitinyl hydrolase 1 [Tulasnella sp. 331]KAG8879115.1 ubiquitinyl hydrolase 1 [Tulasnella sp. 332]
MSATIPAVSRPNLYYFPLESNPTIFTQLLRDLGVSPPLAFSDVLSLDEPDLLAMVPRPVLGLVFNFPSPQDYEQLKAEAEAKRPEYVGSGEGEDVIWFKQTIGNACGLHALLHCVSNGEARSFIQPGSTLANFLNTAIPLTPKSRAIALEDSKEIAKAHYDNATQGDSWMSHDPEVEPPGHYVAFVKSGKNGRMYEMYGNHKGPIDLGPIIPEGEDLLCEPAMEVVREFIRRDAGANTSFSLLALGPSLEEP